MTNPNKPSRYVFSESLEKHKIDDYIKEGDIGPWYDVVPAEAYDKAVEALKKIENNEVCGMRRTCWQSIAEHALKELGELPDPDSGRTV